MAISNELVIFNGLVLFHSLLCSSLLVPPPPSLRSSGIVDERCADHVASNKFLPELQKLIPPHYYIIDCVDNEKLAVK